MHRGQRKHKSQLGSKEDFLEEVMVKAPGRVWMSTARAGVGGEGWGTCQRSRAGAGYTPSDKKFQGQTTGALNAE